MEALKKKGALRGSWLTFCRLLKCGPWHPGGYDPIEEASAPDLDESLSTEDDSLE